jgi:nicotinate-nucleotide adenylyltransferase
MEKIRRSAIYGGSFDPIHIGHIALADSAVRECGLDELIFMPAYMSPFKQDRKVTDGYDRLAMIEESLYFNSAFRVSDYEIRKGGPSYTVETLRHFRNNIDAELYFVLGFDSILQLESWYKGPEILSDYHLITARRPDTDDSKGMQMIDQFREKYDSDITVLEMEPVDASSTEIRRNVAEGRPITGMVLPEVEGYIIEHKLYRP